MRYEEIAFPEPELHARAEEYFIKYSRLDLNREKHRRILQAGREARLAGLAGVNIRAALCVWDEPELCGGALITEAGTLSCPAFSRIRAARVYAFAVSSGGCDYDDGDPIMRQLCADIWGTAYVDVARGLLKARLSAEAEGMGCRLSQCFGPGFYGMDVTQSVTLTRLVKSESIGVTARDNGIMLPLKSCAGIYFAVRDGSVLPPVSCEDCKGNAHGCEFCTVRNNGL